MNLEDQTMYVTVWKYVSTVFTDWDVTFASAFIMTRGGKLVINKKCLKESGMISGQTDSQSL